MTDKVTHEDVAKAKEVLEAAKAQGIQADQVDPWGKKRIRVLVGDREFHIPAQFITGIEHRIGRFEVKPGTPLPKEKSE